MMRRVTFAAATAAPILSRSFSSNFSDDVGTYKRPVKYSSRSGAHRHVTTATPGEARRASRGPYAANNGTKPSSHVSGEADDVLLEDASFPDASEAASMPRNVKNSYSHLFKKKPERISFSTRFSSATDEAPANTEELEEADVTRIYSGEELQSMGNDQQEAEHSADRHAAPLHRPTAYSGTEDEAELTEAAEVEEGEEDPFAQIRRQPFFQEVLNRVERNIARYRKEISGTRRYSASAINDCIRPLLQLADYPFTGTQLSQLANVVNPIILKSSLGDLRSCQKLHIYRSPDTEVVLDWSVEDFLRRRYESIHVSWEPLDVVIRRYGWSNDVVSPRDCLIFFGAFKDHVELAEMVLPPNEKMTAEPIEDAVDRANSGSIPLSRLLIRRKCSAETEPSLTESVRLMGTPALHTTIQGRRSRQQLNSEESVSGMFAAVEQAAQEVDADDETKYRHGMESVSSLRQATHPNGRVIKEFSVGKRIQQRGMADRKVHRDEEDKHNDQTQVKQSDMQSDVTVDEFEKASSAYHKAKVEVSLLRRRLLNTENVDLAAELQEKLADSRRELTRLSELVRRLRSTQLVTREQQSKGFNVPKEQPNYPEAPEHPTTDTKNYQAAEEDSDIDISQYVEETSTELHGVKAAPTKTQTKLEEIELKIEEISSAAEDARVALHKLVEVQRVQEQTMKRKLAAAEDHVRQLEGELQDAEEEKKAEEASILRANMEAEKQRAMEELAVQREAARRAQEEAAQALARQRQAEEEALLLESRLRKKLEDMMEVESAAPTSPSLTAKEGNNSRENLVSEPPRTSAPDRTLSTPPPNDNKEISGGNFFMCTPEQYNGLHLAAGRLRKEITALEGQMEQEGDEDDETLMAALAASRADLEELDECISSVQSGASWAAEQDAKRQHANKQSLLVEDTDAQRVQDEIDQQRFAISLFEKRIQHTSQRSVIAKLEQRIVQARREISRLRIEQDRLRRAGRDTFGLPPSVSMAETLAHEGADNDETGDTPHAGEENGREGDIAAEADSDFDGSPVSQMEAEGDSITGEGASGEGTPSRDGLSTQGTILEAAHAAIGDASEGEARLLRSRLDRMVQSIQQLQEDIVHQERSSDYDDEEAENVLQAMKEKLQVLLKLRDDVERRLPKSATIAHSRSPLMTTAPTPQPLSVLPLKSSVRLTPAAKRLRMMANVRKMKSK